MCVCMYACMYVSMYVCMYVCRRFGVRLLWTFPSWTGSSYSFRACVRAAEAKLRVYVKEIPFLSLALH